MFDRVELGGLWEKVDHRHDWAATRITLLEWIDRLCHHDHDLKTYGGGPREPGKDRSSLQRTRRHPRHTRATGAAAGEGVPALNRQIAAAGAGQRRRTGRGQLSLPRDGEFRCLRIGGMRPRLCQR